METISMGLDAGMGAVKMYADGHGIEFLSQVALNGGDHLDAMMGMRQTERPLMIETADGEFYVGDRAHQFGREIENLDFERLNNSPEMRALVYGAWTKFMQAYGVFDKPLSVMVGLPLQTMGESMKEYRKSMRQWLSGSHTWLADGVPYGVIVERVRLNSQPVGAYFDYVLDEDFKIISARRGTMTSEIGVISVGFNTIELMVVENQAATEKFTGGEKLGVRRLLEMIDPRGQYSLGEMDTKLRNGTLKYKEKLPIWAREVNGAIERTWKEALSRFEAVLVVGGGAVLLGNHLALRNKQVLLDQPVMSIARGLCKLDVLKK
jgi:hypothetical protein